MENGTAKSVRGKLRSGVGVSVSKGGANQRRPNFTSAEPQLQLQPSPHSSTCCLETRSKCSNVDPVPPCSRRSVRRLARRNHDAPANNHAYSNIQSLIIAIPGRNPLPAEKDGPINPRLAVNFDALGCATAAADASSPTVPSFFRPHVRLRSSLLFLPRTATSAASFRPIPPPAANDSPARGLPPCSLTVPARAGVAHSRPSNMLPLPLSETDRCGP
jgi:hypothetical protein